MRAPSRSRFRRIAALALASGLFPSLYAQLSEAEMAALAPKLPASAATKIDFAQHIRPILESSCLRCHGQEKPKGNYRLDTREGALKGDEDGVNIRPGNSSLSPLIYYTARLVEDMEMPPAEKGDPLTAEQVSLLRSWIDQGAEWDDSSTNKTPRIFFSVTPSVHWFAVEGTEQQFREHTGIKEGWNGGVQSVFLQERLAPGRTLTFEGQTFINPESYRFRLQIDQLDFGFIRMGFEQYREYYSDVGGQDPGFDDSIFSLGHDLHMDIGKAWASFGLTIPDRPRIVLGYELQYREGTKSTLQWGDAGSTSPDEDIVGTDAKKVYPSVREIDERIHIVSLDLTHEFRGLTIENNFAAEFFENNSTRRNTGFFDRDSGTLERYIETEERQDHFQASDSFTVQKQVLDWLFLSGGYFYSRLEGDYSFNNQSFAPAGNFGFSENYWFAENIILEQNTHIFNANTQLGPWGGLTLFGGVQSEWMNQRGFGDVQLDEGIPGAIFSQSAPIDSDLDRSVVEEHAGLRYTKIPFTVVFLEGRLAQEDIGQWEGQSGGVYEFLRNTDSESDLYEGRVGFTISPWTPVSVTAHYKQRRKDSQYDHDRDEAFSVKNEGYSAFITDRETETDEISLKLTIRPWKWLKTALTYKRVAIDYTTGTEAFIISEVVPPLVYAPGGSKLIGEYDADVFGASITLTPWRRLSLSSTFTFRNSETTTAHGFSPVVVDYNGDVYSSISSATFVVNDKTDLFGSYYFSWADYGQDNAPEGLPLGLIYDWHNVTAGITRRWKENLATSLQYRFYHYDEKSSRGNNYTAHGVLASLSLSLK